MGYDPHLGSFITPDPAMDGLNHYNYANSNPIKYTDPTGLFVLTIGTITISGGALLTLGALAVASGTLYIIGQTDAKYTVDRAASNLSKNLGKAASKAGITIKNVAVKTGSAIVAGTTIVATKTKGVVNTVVNGIKSKADEKRQRAWERSQAKKIEKKINNTPNYKNDNNKPEKPNPNNAKGPLKLLMYLLGQLSLLLDNNIDENGIKQANPDNNDDGKPTIGPNNPYYTKPKTNNPKNENKGNGFYKKDNNSDINDDRTDSGGGSGSGSSGTNSSDGLDKFFLIIILLIIFILILYFKSRYFNNNNFRRE